MQPTPVTTIEQARALPEAPKDYEIEVLETGETVRRWRERKFYPAPIVAKQILFFTDADGRTMRVEYEENGPVKKEFRGFY